MGHFIFTEPPWSPSPALRPSLAPRSSAPARAARRRRRRRRPAAGGRSRGASETRGGDVCSSQSRDNQGRMWYQGDFLTYRKWGFEATKIGIFPRKIRDPGFCSKYGDLKHRKIGIEATNMLLKEFVSRLGSWFCMILAKEWEVQQQKTRGFVSKNGNIEHCNRATTTCNVSNMVILPIEGSRVALLYATSAARYLHVTEASVHLTAKSQVCQYNSETVSSSYPPVVKHGNGKPTMTSSMIFPFEAPIDRGFPSQMGWSSCGFDVTSNNWDPPKCYGFWPFSLSKLPWTGGQSPL